MGIVSVTDVCSYLGNGLHPSVSVTSRVGVQRVSAVVRDSGIKLKNTALCEHQQHLSGCFFLPKNRQ